ASRSFAVRIGSFHGTRTIGTAGVVEIAASIPTAAWKSTGPCWRSMGTASKPWCAISSAENGFAIASHALSTVLPSALIFLSSFLRMRDFLPIIEHFRIDRVPPDRLAVEYAEHVVGGFHPHAIDRFTRHTRHMRRSHEICELQERMIRRRRFGIEHI